MDPTTTTSVDPGSTAALLAIVGAYFVVLIVVAIVYIVSMWKIFTKAGKPGWAAIIPIYDLIVLLEVVGRPTWWIALYIAGFILAIIPVIGFLAVIGLAVLGIIIAIDLAKSFGRGSGFGIGLAFLGIIFYPMLAFGSAKYVGPAAAKVAVGAPR